MKTELVELKENTEIFVKEDTQYVLNLSDGNSRDGKSITLVFEQEGISAEILGLYHLKSGEILNLTTNAIHKVPNTVCYTKVRGVLSDKSHSDYTGKIIIEKNAQQTTSFLEDSVLVTGKGAVNNSSPILQIDANDVKASHGATTGRISEESIYYLMSRGLDRKEAEDLTVKGFFDSLLNLVKDEKVKEEILKHL